MTSFTALVALSIFCWTLLLPVWWGLSTPTTDCRLGALPRLIMISWIIKSQSFAELASPLFVIDHPYVGVRL